MEVEVATTFVKHLTTEMYLVHIHVLISFLSNKHRQMQSYVIKHHFINTVPNSNMFQPLIVVLKECSWYNWVSNNW
jgi:hypothetical protein